MNQGQSNTYREISKIIERDSKSTTYKYALLRATIDVVQENSPHIEFKDSRVHFPVGLLVEKWLIYYYPIIDADFSIPQIHGSAKLAFEAVFKDITLYYKNKGGFSAFYNDFRNIGIPDSIQERFLALVKSLRQTIVSMPMKYLGRSVTDEFYSVFRKEMRMSTIRPSECTREKIVMNSGTFSIPRDFFEAFSLLGSFIGGQESILFKWAQFSVSAASGLTTDKVLKEILRGPVTERDVLTSKHLYKEMLSDYGIIYCVWSGRKLSAYDIDHVIPFSVWKNNDLWNLLPSNSKINNQKSDRIPSPETIRACSDRIIDYWSRTHEKHPIRFKTEVQGTLIGYGNHDNWQERSINRLELISNDLIENRGFQTWNPSH